MTRKFGPYLNGRTVTKRHRGVTKTRADWGNEPAPSEEITITAWDGKTVLVPETIASISQGHVVPAEEGGTYVVLSDLPDFNTVTELTGETDTGTPVKINLVPRRQYRGHAKGINYMLPIDKTTGMVAFEKGRSGHKYFATRRPRNDVSGKGGYTKQDIATELGVALSSITDTWIRDNGIYGKSENKPLAFETAAALWSNLLKTRGGNGRFFESNWLVIEAGFDYSDFRHPSGGNFIPDHTSGESPFHPVLITSYGTGTRPFINHTGAAQFQDRVTGNWICQQNVDCPYIWNLSAFSAIYSHVDVWGHKERLRYRGGFYLQGGGHKTMYRCGSFDAHPLPADANSTQLANNNWGSGGAKHHASVYTETLDSFLCLESYPDMGGWERGYDLTNRIFADPADPTTFLPVPPTALAHNFYIQHNHANATLRRNWVTRGSSHAIQIRPGGIVEDNVLAEANVFGNAPGTSKDPVTDINSVGRMGNYISFVGNILTSGGYKRVASNMRPAAVNFGFSLDGSDPEAFENIVMHWANPDDAAERVEKLTNQGKEQMAFAFNYGSDTEYAQPHDNCFWDWVTPTWISNPDNAIAKGADPAVLDETTIQRFAATQMDLTGVEEGDKIHAYFDWLRTLTPAQREEQRRLFQQYFREPWPGLYRAPRTAATTDVFQPNRRFSGVLWADRRNWLTEMVPGTVYKDSVQLRGATTRFGEVTSELATVDGEGAALLECVSGRLTADTLNNIDVVRVRDVSGQLYIKTATNVPTFLVTQGRLVFDCPISGKDLIIDDQYAQVFLGPDYTVSNGKVLDIRIGKQGYIGHKGSGTAALKVQSGGIMRFRHFDAVTTTTSLTAAMPKLERIQEDWSTPASTVNVTVTLDAGSIIEVEKGAAVAGSVHDLTGPGYTFVDNGAILPPGLVITNGKPIYTVPA